MIQKLHTGWLITLSLLHFHFHSFTSITQGDSTAARGWVDQQMVRGRIQPGDFHEQSRPCPGFHRHDVDNRVVMKVIPGTSC